MADQVYDDLKRHFSKSKVVQLPGPKGAQGLKYNGKMFAMFHKGELLVQLSPERVQAVIKTKQGKAHDPGTGKPMKGRVLIPASKKKSWVKLCEESLEYVRNS